MAIKETQTQHLHVPLVHLACASSLVRILAKVSWSLIFDLRSRHSLFLLEQRLNVQQRAGVYLLQTTWPLIFDLWSPFRTSNISMAILAEFSWRHAPLYAYSQSVGEKRRGSVSLFCIGNCNRRRVDLWSLIFRYLVDGVKEVRLVRLLQRDQKAAQSVDAVLNRDQRSRKSVVDSGPSCVYRSTWR